MNIVHASIPEILILEPGVFSDERGFFYESFNELAFAKKTGLNPHFVQDNHSRSEKNVLRGLHYQILQPQGKLVRVIFGVIYDVALDMRRSSPGFGQWTANVLSDQNKCALWIPPGFAHGFLVTSDYAEVLYKTTDYWFPEHERCIAWNDPKLGITWPLEGAPKLSTKDRHGTHFGQAEVFP